MAAMQVRRRLATLAFAVVFAATAVAPARGNPSGGTVTAGSATIAAGPATVTVQQTSNRAIINWQSFSIGAGELTRFLLPSASSAVLNRVTAANPSQISGQLFQCRSVACDQNQP